MQLNLVVVKHSVVPRGNWYHTVEVMEKLTAPLQRSPPPQPGASALIGSSCGPGGAMEHWVLPGLCSAVPGIYQWGFYPTELL